MTSDLLRAADLLARQHRSVGSLVRSPAVMALSRQQRAMDQMVQSARRLAPDLPGLTLVAHQQRLAVDLAGPTLRLATAFQAPVQVGEQLRATAWTLDGTRRIGEAWAPYFEVFSRSRGALRPLGTDGSTILRTALLARLGPLVDDAENLALGAAAPAALADHQRRVQAAARARFVLWIILLALATGITSGTVTWQGLTHQNPFDGSGVADLGGLMAMISCAEKVSAAIQSMVDG